MHPYFLSLLFIWLNATTVISLAHQLMTEGGEDANGAISKCIDKEKHVLLDFKAHLEDPDGRLLTWRTEDDCCKWIGVTCNHQTGYVTELDLSYKFDSRFLRGEISPSLLHLSYLNHLDLHFNNFNGTVPESIGFLTELRYLDLSRNNFNGTIPGSIGLLTELRYLDLSGNSFHGSIPLEFGNLKNLRSLSLGPQERCQIENLDWLSRLSHLQSLQMTNISLAKANHWVNVILSLQNLTLLSLQACNLSEVMDPYSSFVNSSSSIQFLNLESNNLNSSMYRWLFPLTSSRLHHLYLSYNMLDGIPKYFGNLCSLESLYLDDNLIAVKFPDFLNNLSGCTSVALKTLAAWRNQLTGSLSDEIQNFSSLDGLFLDSNQLNGTMSDKVWELPFLETLFVSSNSLRGSISSESILGSNIRSIDISNNSLEVIPSKPQVSNLSHLEYVEMNDCSLWSSFPKWILTHKNLTNLNIGNTGVSDTIPIEFWNAWPAQLGNLNLSSNNITGEIPDLSSNFGAYASIDLSSNNLRGPIPNVSSTSAALNLSRNKFCGGISFVCQLDGRFLVFLDLSYNSLTGKIPNCLWHFKELKVLNLGHNNLFGRLPASMGYLVQLKMLHLYNNSFLGELPLALKNCTELKFLNLGANKFSSNVPFWIGENLTQLYALSLRSNNFFGPIPLQLCHLMYLQVLDLSRNNLNGTIPSCLKSLTVMDQGSFSPEQNIQDFISYFFSISYVGNAMIDWQGKECEVTSTLGFLTSIDLSSNNLTGQIPNELTDLYGLLVLNLSKNALLGEIPQKIGDMTKLLTLDLSRNKISGEIPSTMSQMTLLNYLDISYNNLSGRIPSSTQLQSFEPSRYTGNAGLCGPPITKYCPGDEEFEAPPMEEHENGREDTNELQRWFYIGGSIGFGIGFWIACGALLLNRNGRHAFIHFLDSFEDWVYVKVVVFIRRFQRVAHT